MSEAELMMPEMGTRPVRRQIRRRALAPEQRREFDVMLLSGERVDRLARLFGIEPWYARRRAQQVLRHHTVPTVAEEVGSRQRELPDGLTPTEYACRILGRQVAALPNGYYRLGGMPAGPRDLVRAANLVLRERGQPAIRYPGLHPLDN